LTHLLVKRFTDQFESWVLTWLLAEAYEMAANPREAWRLQTSVYSQQGPYISGEVLPYIMPDSFVGHIKSDIEADIRLKRMEKKGLLSSRSYSRDPEPSMRYFLTANGALRAREFLKSIPELIDSEGFENWVKNTQMQVTNNASQPSSRIEQQREDTSSVQSGTKNFLIELRSKFKNRGQDEIITTVITLAKRYGPSAFNALIKFIQESAK
jgi:hypothetical protein